MQLQLAKQRVIAGVFNQHRIAMGNKTSNDQVQRMVGAMGGDDLAGAGGDRITGQFLRQMLAQAGIAQAVAVAKQRVDLGAHDLAGELVQAHVHQPFHRREAFTERRMPRFTDELLAHQPDGVHRSRIGLRFVRFAVVGAALTDKKALAMARFDQPLGGQGLIGIDHGIFRMTEQAHAFA